MLEKSKTTAILQTNKGIMGKMCFRHVLGVAHTLSAPRKTKFVEEE